MNRRTLLAAVCLASAFAATPQLTTIQDVLYKADGTPFNGTLTISWSGFQSADNDAIVTQSTTVKVVAGVLHVKLVPSPTNPATPYAVVYNAEGGKVQFQESWLVPVSSQPVRVSAVRVTSAAASTGTGGTANQTTSTGSGPFPESDVTGLLADLAARPLEGPSYAPSRVAFVDSLGLIDAVGGNASDCLHVDGSSGSCGTLNLSFMDGDTPGGVVDGSNRSFTLSATPNPTTSLALYRNGVMQKTGQDYTATGNSVQFTVADAPQPGDTLLAYYRTGTSSGGSSSSSSSYPAPEILCSGAGASTTATAKTSMGACEIPAGVLLVGDRVEVHFDLTHTGTASGFTFEVDWAATPFFSRSGATTDALITGRADAAVLTSGSQLSAQSWGTVLPFAASVTPSSDAYANGLTINFQAMLAQAGDTLTLVNYTVVRLP